MFRPMLAATASTVPQQSFLVSPKIDGIRCLIIDGVAMSRNLKPLPNEQLREVLSHPLLTGLDGELVAGSATDALAFNGTTRAVMGRKADAGHVLFQVFDDFSDPTLPFEARLEAARRKVQKAQAHDLPVAFLQHTYVRSQSGLEALYETYLQQGYEGAMLRDPIGPYKHGRSTTREAWLLKLKPFQDAEAEILDVEELHRNLNPKELSELGYAKRSTAKDGKVAADTLGSLRVRDVKTGIIFRIGGGFTQAQRDELWQARESIPGRLVRYKSCTIGVKDAPRFPVFLGFRDDPV
jgi:DNA ligase-1